MKKFISILLVFAMLLSVAMIPSFAASPEVITQLADALFLHKNSFYSSNASGDVNENYLVYTPNPAVTPYLAHGNDVAGAASMAKVFRLEAEAGNSLLAGVNADYFTLANGVPLGLEMKDGLIKSSSHSTFPEVGFTADGRAIIGRSNLSVVITNTTKAFDFQYINYNKALSSGSGAVLFSEDFEDTNRASGDTLNLVISRISGTATPNGKILGVVKEVISATDKLELADGELVLSVLTSQNLDVQERINACSVGDQIEVSFAMDPAWQNVTQAFGGKEMLIEAGSVKTFSDGTRAPRTALGIKADGTIVVYTCDGRDYGGSKGLSLSELARRMNQLGCVTAINLDGGASTQVHVVYPGNENPEQVNEDAGTSLRSCGNYICFKNNLPATGMPVQLYAYPAEITAASGSEKAINVKARDANWHPVNIPPALFTYSLSSPELGSVEAGVFSAGMKKMDGTLIASFGDLSINYKVHVLTEGMKVEDFEAYDLANTDLNYVHNGRRSLMMIDGAYYPLTASFTNKIPTMVSFWTYGDANGLYLDYIAGEPVQTKVESYSNGWTRQIVDLTQGASALVGIGYSGNSVVYVDQIMAGFGTFIDDVAPTISINFTDDYMFAVVKDDVDEKISANNITVTYDARRVDFSYSEDAGILTATLPADSELHHLIITATDASGNIGRTATPVITADEDLTEHSYVFADLGASNWSTQYVEYLYNRGILSGSEKNGKLYYRPTANMTRQEFAKTIVTWYGIDANAFSDLTLNFADNSKISDWAAPYVKAAVSLGLMGGKNTKGSLKFDPSGSITRQEVMTVIGRIMEKGYEASDLAMFNDKAAVASYALPYVKVLTKQNIITGSNGKLNPNSPVTREQVAKIIFEIN